MKLQFDENEYYLMEDGNEIAIATTDQSFIDELGAMKLSKENCDETFGVTDVNKLANQNAKKDLFNGGYDGLINAHQQMLIEVSYINGFKKAMELNKDKLFTVEDMISAYHQGTNDGASYESACGDHDSYEQMKEARKESEDDYSYFIESLQQPKEIEVEIVTQVDLAATPVDSRHPDAYLGTDTGIPMLDEGGCLILKKK